MYDTRSEKTKIGSMVSAALVSTLVGLAASNLGFIPYEVLAYLVVLEFLLLLTVPLLLFRADLRRVTWSTGTLLLAFLLGSDVATDMESNLENKLPILQTATALAVSFAICKTATYLTNLFGMQGGGSLPAITAIVIILATILPSHFAYLALVGDAVSLVLMQLCFLDWECFFALTLRCYFWHQTQMLEALHQSAGGMATAKGWTSSVVPGILSGFFGVSIATFLGIGLGMMVLRFM